MVRAGTRPAPTLLSCREDVGYIIYVVAEFISASGVGAVWGRHLVGGYKTRPTMVHYGNVTHIDVVAGFIPASGVGMVGAGTRPAPTADKS